MEAQKLMNGYWWEQGKEKLHETLFGIVEFLSQNQSYRREMNLRHMRLYGNVNTLGLSAYNYAQTPLNSSQDKLTFNLIQSVVDTLTSKIAKNQPKPTFLTNKGDYKKKRKAQKLSRFSLGQLHATKMYEKAPEMFRHGAIFGTGAAKVYRVGAEIKVDMTFIDELLLDDSEAIYGEPMNIYQTKFVQREVAMREWPEFADKLRFSKALSSTNPQNSNLSDMIQIVEAWHRATLDEEGKPHGGRHAIAADNVTVFEETYKRPYFPFLFYKPTRPLLGFFGMGSAERLTGLQIEINKLLRTAQLSFHLCGIPQYWVLVGAKTPKGKIVNEVGHVNTYEGQKPVLDTPAPINPIFLSHIWNLVQKGYEQEGVSQLSANSQKPSGLDSGKALREFNDIESERFMLLGRSYEEVFMEASRQFLDLGKEIDAELKEKGKGGYTVKVHDRKFMESIPWSEVDMAEDEYVMQIFPTSLLSSTPAGKLQDVQEMTQAGLIPPDYAAELLDFPDLDKFLSMKNAAIEDIERTIEKLVDGDYMPPEPYQNLQLGLQMVQSAYLNYRDEGLEEDRLELLRRWMSEAQTLLNPPAPPLPMAVPTAPGIAAAQPQAVPEAAPVSDMLPNAPAMVQ